jgi:uncharacterized protein (DUF2336 family)
LVDIAVISDSLAQTAIAMRPHLSAQLAAALAEVGAEEAVAALSANLGAHLTLTTMERVVERFGKSATVREALLSRPHIPVNIRQSIAVAVSQSLSSFVTHCGWLTGEKTERIAREAREKATVILSHELDHEKAAILVSHLRKSGQLTPALVLRAILSHGASFAEAAFCDLADTPLKRVRAILQDRKGAGFPALYKKAGLPESLRPAFEAALSGLREDQYISHQDAQLSRRMIERTLTACSSLSLEDSGKLMALLGRFEVEAARDEARELADAMADEAALTMVLRHAPYILLEHDNHKHAA